MLDPGFAIGFGPRLACQLDPELDPRLDPGLDPGLEPGFDPGDGLWGSTGLGVRLTLGFNLRLTLGLNLSSTLLRLCFKLSKRNKMNYYLNAALYNKESILKALSAQDSSLQLFIIANYTLTKIIQCTIFYPV